MNKQKKLKQLRAAMPAVVEALKDLTAPVQHADSGDVTQVPVYEKVEWDAAQGVLTLKKLAEDGPRVPDNNGATGNDK